MPRGKSLQFINRDPELTVFHTVTGCKAPCNKTAGIGFPLADGAPFDSGQLGYGPVVNLDTILPDGDDEIVPITAGRPAQDLARRRRTSSAGPTPTSAACTPSCAAPSASSNGGAARGASMAGGR